MYFWENKKIRKWILTLSHESSISGELVQYELCLFEAFNLKKKFVNLAVLKEPPTSLKVRWVYETLFFSKFRFVLKKRVLSQFSFSVPRGFPLEHPPFVTRGELPTLIFWLGLRNGSSGKRGKRPGSRNDQIWKWRSHIEYCYIKKSFLLMLVKLVALFTCRRRELRTNTLSKFKWQLEIFYLVMWTAFVYFAHSLFLWTQT